MIVTVHLSWHAVCYVIEGKIPQPDMLSGVLVSTLKCAHQLPVSFSFIVFSLLKSLNKRLR